jgi:hypothetical protein
MTTEKFPTIDDRELSDLLLAVAGIALDAVNRSVEITDIGSVSLGDILAVREDPIWDAHHGIAIEHLPDRTKPYSSQKFVKDPLDSMSKISNSLGNVVTRLGQIQKRRRLFDAVERWEIRFSALGVFEMIASEAGHAFFGLPHLPSDPISEHSLTKGTIPIVAHAVVFLEGGGLKYEIKQPVFQGKMWAEQAANVAQEVRRRLSFNGTEIAPSGDQARPDQQGGGIEVKDQDD